MKRKVLLVSLIVALSLSIAGVLVARSKAKPSPGVARITYLETVKRADGQIETRGARVRIVERATGQYRETAFAPDGKEKDSQLVSRQGVFVISRGAIYPSDEARLPSPESLSGAKIVENATGKATIAGLTAYLNKSASGSVEVWTSPELGSHIPLKVVMHNGDRNGFTQLEAVRVVYEEAAPGLFDLPDLPISTSKLEAQINHAKETNDQARIQRYTNLLAKWKR